MDSACTMLTHSRCSRTKDWRRMRAKGVRNFLQGARHLRSPEKSRSLMPPATVFGPAYFKKFYLSASTRVVTPGEMRVRARLIAAILAQTGIPVRTIMDAGCGIGLLRAPFKEVLPRARYAGLEASDYLCARYGWTKGSVVDYSPQKPCDLVVCYDVLQYLNDRDAARAVANLARLTGAALYMSALTREDWRENCDKP